MSLQLGNFDIVETNKFNIFKILLIILLMFNEALENLHIAKRMIQ